MHNVTHCKRLEITNQIAVFFKCGAISEHEHQTLFYMEIPMEI